MFWNSNTSQFLLQIISMHQTC